MPVSFIHCIKTQKLVNIIALTRIYGFVDKNTERIHDYFAEDFERFIILTKQNPALGHAGLEKHSVAFLSRTLFMGERDQQLWWDKLVASQQSTQHMQYQ